MQAFSPDAARAVDQRFADQRVAAAERAAAAEWPTPAEEIWRYSRVDELDLDRFAPAAATTTIDGLRGLRRRPTSSELPDVIGGAAPDVFAELNTAFAAPIVVRVPAGTTVAEPIIVTHEIAGDGTAVVPPPRHRRRRRQRGHGRRAVHVGRRRHRARRARAPGARRAGGAGQLPRRQRAGRRGVADRPPAGRRRPRLDASRWPPSPSAGTTPGSAPRPASPVPAAAPARSRCTSPAASRCTTSARSRTTTPRTPPATCCSRAPCRTSRAASTPA